MMRNATSAWSCALVPDVARACHGACQLVVQVKSTTIEETYAELYPELRNIIPTNVAPPLTDEDWKKFPEPKVKDAAAA